MGLNSKSLQDGVPTVDDFLIALWYIIILIISSGFEYFAEVLFPFSSSVFFYLSLCVFEFVYALVRYTKPMRGCVCMSRWLNVRA